MGFLDEPDLLSEELSNRLTDAAAELQPALPDFFFGLPWEIGSQNRLVLSVEDLVDGLIKTGRRLASRRDIAEAVSRAEAAERRAADGIAAAERAQMNAEHARDLALAQCDILREVIGLRSEK